MKNKTTLMSSHGQQGSRRDHINNSVNVLIYVRVFILYQSSGVVTGAPYRCTCVLAQESESEIASVSGSADASEDG